jgi:AMP phosphorylase
MKLSVKLLDIANRGVLLHSTDARNMRIRDGDRVLIADEATGKTAQAHVDTTGSLIEPGAIGVYRPLNATLAVEEGASVEVRSAERPASSRISRRRWTAGGLPRTRPWISSGISSAIPYRPVR